MKFSEAVRLGSMMSEQAVGAYIDHAGRTCALGAAYLAITTPRIAGYVDDGTAEAEVSAMWPELRSSAEMCPLCRTMGNRGYIVAHLNDYHLQARERIAAWYERLEQRAVDNREVEGSSPSPATTEEPVLVGA